jgi:hypothetical protein
VHDSAVEHALDGHGFSLDDGVAILTAGPEIDQGASRAIVENELVAEDLGDASLHGDGVCSLQLVDGHRLQQHDTLRLPALGHLDAACARGRAGNQHGERGPCQQAARPALPARRGCRVRSVR